VGGLMGDPKVKLTAAIFEQGQNEGIERTVLPLPQLSYLQNARMRKSGRIGKRFGYSTGIATGFSGVTSGPPRCVGGSPEVSFAVVADRCFTYAQGPTGVGYVLPANTDAISATTGGGVSRRIAGAVSGWVPNTSFFPVPAKSLKNQTTTPCASCYAFGCLWTAYQYTDPANPTDKLIRVSSTDAADQSVVTVLEYAAGVAGGGGLQFPRLVTIGSTLALLYIDANSSTVRGRTVTGNTRFGGEVVITGAGILSYDVSPYSSTACLFAISYGGNAISVGTLNTALAPATVNTFVEVNPITSVSIVGSPTTPVYAGYGISASAVARVRVYATGFGGGLVGSVTLPSDASRPLLSLIPAGGVRAVHSSLTSGVPNAASFKYSDVSALAVIGLTITLTGFYPIAVPFFAGPEVYIWTAIDTLTGGPRYAALLKISTDFIASTTCVAPLEMSVQDLLLTFASFDLKGVPVVTQIASTAAYAVTVPTIYALSSAVVVGHEFRVLQTKHYTDSAQNRSLQSVNADRSSFVLCGNLTRVDARGAVEEGFVHSPVFQSIVPAAGGALTASSDYYYTAIYKARGGNGRFEVSAPAPPIKATMAAGQTQNTLAITSLCSTQRISVSIEIYRTLHDDKTFYLAAIVDSDLFGGTITYVDQLSDTTLSVQQALYTQVGQTLPNAFPPASRFGCSGGGRLILGGLIRPDVVHASKLIFGDQSPSFADNDGFRIVLPSACTGLAWCDSLVLFTAEGIYLASGEGPDDSGIGDFGTLVRLPFQLGCVEPRSVFACDEGVFFQTSRGLYLLPRGFGTPVAIDSVLDTLATYPTICGVATLVKATEQTVRWVCVNSSNQGAQLVYDLVHKAWSIDLLADVGALGTPAAQYGIGNWYGGEIAMFTSSQSDGTTIKLTHGSFDDGGQPYAMLARTGDVRPFGPTEQGSVQRLSTLLELRSACTLTVDKTSDRGVAHAATRVYTGVGPDTVAGELSTVLADLGSTEQRSLSALRIQISESSATEGIALIALALENGAPEGARLNKPADRIV
jgi:hypothetical protein